MILEQGRPKDTSTRIQTEIAAYDFLDSLGIQYSRADHEPAMTMEVCAEIDKILDAQICKNLFLCNRQQTDFYLLLIPADKRFKTKDLSAQINSSRLSFADGELMQKYLKTSPGSASILSMLFNDDKNVRLLIDEQVLKSEYLGCHPCINTSSLRIKTSDVIEKIIPAMGITYTKVTLPDAE